MAIVTRTAGNLSLELDGKPAGPLRSAQPPSLHVDLASTRPGNLTGGRRGGRVVLGELVASADLAEPGPLLDWLQAAVAGKLPLRDGAVLVADANFKLQRRIAFQGARLTGLDWPALDASDGKRPFTLSLRWLADSVDDGAVDGKTTVTPVSGRRKLPLCGNFRVGGLPFDGAAVVRVALPALSVNWVSDQVGGLRPGLQLASRQLGPLSLTVGARQAAAARAWARKLAADGAVDEHEGLALQVDLLDAALKKVLVGVQLQGCLLVGMDEDALDAGVDRLPGVTLHFDVAGLAISVPG